jgi:DNA-binding transcriptional MerR regulator
MTTPESTTSPAYLRIGDFAALAGVSPRTVRYYEERDLVRPAIHTAGGERRYDPGDLSQLRRILDLRDALGLTLDEVSVLIESERLLAKVKAVCRDPKPNPDSGPGQQLLRESIAIHTALVQRIEKKLLQLQGLNNESKECMNIARKLLKQMQDKSGT